jgi:3-hydroxyisobutyrate dehydrogenase-like beta-hydroxyacid dehydrogenase
MAAERIGFLGLGIMGSRMAANVARAGYPLAVWTHTPGKADSWVAEHGGAQACATPAEVAARSEIVISMVVDGEQVAAVLLGEQGAIEGARPGTLFVDSSTIGPSQTRAIGAALEQRGAEMLDAPVTGSSPRAQDGTLTIMAGGSEQAFARAEPLLRTMGELVVHVGELGQGERVKLINNSLGAANAAALAEALVLAAAAGIDLDALIEVLAAGSGASAQLQLKARPMREHDYTTLFKAEHMLKDVTLCMEEAQHAGVPFPAAAHAHEVLSATVGRGHGADDYASMIEAVEGFAGRRL